MTFNPRFVLDLSWHTGDFYNNGKGDSYKIDTLHYTGFGLGLAHLLNNILAIDFVLKRFNILDDLELSSSYFIYIVGLNLDILAKDKSSKENQLLTAF